MENQKWKNLDAGRIQVKRVNAAYARLMTEHNRKIEINGVHGGTESRCVIYSPFSREVRPEVTEAIQRVGERFGWTLTAKNAKDVEKALLAELPALEATRPIEDCRKTQAEVDEIKARQAEQEAKWKEQSEEHDRVVAEIEKLRPSWAVNYIIAQRDIYDCDSMSDYYNIKIAEQVVIGFTRSHRNNFDEWRKAAATFAPTAHLADDRPEFEHRDDYAGGEGYFLKNGDRYTSGWRVFARSSLRVYGTAVSYHLPDYEQQQAAANTGAVGELGEVRRNHAQNGVEIVFPQRPEQGIIDAIKRVGFRWSRSRGLWYNRFSAEAWETACKIVGAESDASFSP